MSLSPPDSVELRRTPPSGDKLGDKRASAELRPPCGVAPSVPVAFAASAPPAGRRDRSGPRSITLRSVKRKLRV